MATFVYRATDLTSINRKRVKRWLLLSCFFRKKNDSERRKKEKGRVREEEGKEPKEDSRSSQEGTNGNNGRNITDNIDKHLSRSYITNEDQQVGQSADGVEK